MGPIEDETAYWLGGDGYALRVFTSRHQHEADFAEDELSLLEHLLNTRANPGTETRS